MDGIEIPNRNYWNTTSELVLFEIFSQILIFKIRVGELGNSTRLPEVFEGERKTVAQQLFRATLLGNGISSLGIILKRIIRCILVRGAVFLEKITSVFVCEK